MATPTPYLNLTRDDPTENYSVGRVNANSDKIDAETDRLNDEIAAANAAVAAANAAVAAVTTAVSNLGTKVPPALFPSCCLGVNTSSVGSGGGGTALNVLAVRPSTSDYAVGGITVVSNKIKIPKTGYWRVDATVYCDGGGNAVRRAQIWVNSASASPALSQTAPLATGHSATPQVQANMRLNKDDLVQPGVLVVSDSTVTISGGVIALQYISDLT